MLCLLLLLVFTGPPLMRPWQPARAETPEQPVGSPAASPAFGSSVPLVRWNASERRRELLLVDPVTGQEVPDSPAIGADWPRAFSADGKWLAIHEPRGQSCESFAGGTACRGGAGVLHLVDLPVWRQVTTALPAQGWVGPLTFSPDTTRLALAANERQVSTLMLVDTASGMIVGQRALDPGFRPSLLVYRHDGAALAVYGQPLGIDPGMLRPGPPRALLVDAATLEVEWDQALPSVLSGQWCRESCQASHEQVLFASWTPAAVPSPDGSRLHVVHADADRLTTVDLEARAVRTADTRAERSWLEWLLGLVVGVAQAKGGTEGVHKAAALSRDGTRLYVVGRSLGATRGPRGMWHTTEASLGLPVVDVQTGRVVAAREGEGVGAHRIRLTPDGAHLLLHGWEQGAPSTEVLDAQTLHRVAHLPGWEVVALGRADRQPVVLASQPGQQATQLAVLDPRSFEIVRSWTVSTHAAWVAMP